MEGTAVNRPPYRWAVVTFAVIFAIYVVTLSPTAAFWDTAEYIAAAKVLGIPHPPGNPLFTLMAHVWGLMPLGADYAKRINLFAAATSAVGAGFWFLIAERWLRSILPARGPRLLAAFAGVFASAMAWTMWNQSTVNEKVYTVSLMSIAMVVWCAVYWADQPAGERRDRWIVLAVYISMLSSTNHQMGILGLPVVAWYVIATDWRIVLRWRVVAAVVAAYVIGISLHYIYLPIRAAQFPPINEGEPIGFFSQALMDNLARLQYAKPGLFPRQPWAVGDPVNNLNHMGAQLWMYWNYWSWQWGRDLGSLASYATGLFTAIGLGGMITLVRRDRRAGIAAIGLFLTLTVLLVFYLNFKFGFSYQLDNKAISIDMREVRERDYFFIGSFAFIGVILAAGFAGMIRAIGEYLGDRVTDERRWVVGTPVVLLALIPLIGNHITAPRSGETLARDFAIDILNSCEPYGILITAGDNDTFPLWYAQEVLGVRPDVTLANLSLMNTDWHLRQIRRRIEPVFDPATAAPFWRPRTDSANVPLGGVMPPTGGWLKATTPVISMSEAELNQLPEMMQAPPTAPTYGKVALAFTRPYLERADLATILLIRDNLGKRPIYFSWSDADYPDERLGLGPYLLTSGFVRKLMPDSLKVGGSIVQGQYFGFIDLERTRQLLFGVYHPDAAAHSRARGWVDAPSATILQLYALTYLSAAQLLANNGDSVYAKKAEALGTAMAKSMPGRSGN